MTDRIKAVVGVRESIITGAVRTAKTGVPGSQAPSISRRLIDLGVPGVNLLPARGGEYGELVDLPGAITETAAGAGLIPIQRCVALLAGIRGDRLVTRASFFHRNLVGKARQAGLPWMLTCYEDVIIAAAPRSPRHALARTRAARAALTRAALPPTHPPAPDPASDPASDPTPRPGPLALPGPRPTQPAGQCETRSAA